MASFKELYLNEKLAGNKFYAFLENKIEDLPEKQLRNPNYMFYGGDEKHYFFPLSKEMRYKRFLKGVKDTAVGTSRANNFIYQITKNVKLFNPKYDSEYFLDKLSDEALTEIADYHGFTDEAGFTREGKIGRLITQFQKSGVRTEWDILNNNKKLTKEFKKIFDGWEKTKDIEAYMFTDVFLKNNKLVDGIIPRYSISNKDVNIEIPQYIKDDLQNYFMMGGRRLKKETTEWAETNLPKNKKAVTVYRGIMIDLNDTFGIWSTEEAIEKYNTDAGKKLFDKKLKKMFKIKDLEELQKGNKVTLTRGQVSSWSRTPQVAQSFAKGADIGVIVKMQIKPEDIVIDFTNLSAEMKKDFAFSGQNEVAAKTGKYQATITNVMLDSHGYGEKFLDGIGYKMKQNKIQKKGK